MSAESSPKHEFIIDYIKSRFFRVVYADGVWGGVTANQNIHMVLWNSRDAIPRQIRYGIDDDGEIIETGRKVRADQVREVEVAVTMSTETARLVRDWLDEMIAEAEGIEPTLGVREEADHNA